MTCVVDCGRAKETRYDDVNALACLAAQWVSAAAARQRRGRAGRTAPGAALRLYTRAQHAALAAHTPPELLRTPLEGLCLTVLSMRLGHPARLLSRALQPPQPRAVDNALALLAAIGALDVSSEGGGVQDDASAASGTLAPALTPLGWHLAALPVDPRIGKMLVTAAALGCAPAAATVAAALAHRDPFLLPLTQRDAADAARRRLAGGAPSDHVALLRAHAGWRAAGRAGGAAAARAFAQRNFLSHATLGTMHAMRAQFLELLADARLLADPRAQDNDAVMRFESDAAAAAADVVLLTGVLAAGLFPSVAAVAPGRRPRVRTRQDGRVEIHPGSVLAREDASAFAAAPWLVYSDKVKTRAGVCLRGCTAVSDIALLLFGGQLQLEEPARAYRSDAATVDDPSAAVALRMRAPDGGFLAFSAPRRTAALVLSLRRRLDELLAAAMRTPGLDVAAAGGAALLAATRQLLHEAAGSCCTRPQAAGS